MATSHFVLIKLRKGQLSRSNAAFSQLRILSRTAFHQYDTMSQSNLRVVFNRSTHIGFYEAIYGGAIALLSFVDHKCNPSDASRKIATLGLELEPITGAALLIKVLSLWHRATHRGRASLIAFHSAQTILRKKTLVRNRNTRTKAS